ncbi:MAG TPA: ABC transporter permease subunit [Candidatus Eisenbacteria bacterium]|nr:ABC transporter permease subunit [Candidatus Eisenbacteria bacterium]
MSFRRFAATFWLEFSHAVRRPLFIVLAVILALSGFGLSSGSMQISSGDSSVGGTKAWITSEFAQTQMMTFIILLYYGFFLSIAAGLGLLRDRELKIDVLLQTTSLRPGEYVLGRFTAVFAIFAVLLFWQVMVNAFFNHLVPNPNAAEMRGPFLLSSYVVPVLTLGLPFVVFFAGLSMLIGERTRSAILVFVLPVALLLVCAFFLWTWSPSWLDQGLNRLMQILDPSGYRWLNETHLKVDRGVEYYNTQPVPYDAVFWLNRVWMLAIGFVALWLTVRAVERSRKGVVASRRALARSRKAAAVEAAAAPIRPVVAGEFGTSGRGPSFVQGVLAVAAAEGRELLRQPGLYIFIPLILLQALGNALVAIGPFDTPILLTPGITAVGIGNQITTFACMLLLFYTVESLERERTTGLASVLYSTPLRTGAYLFGKALANSMVAVAVLLASLAASAIALAVQGKVPFSFEPYLVVWGLLLVPTFLVWTSFVTALYAAVGNRYGAYALAVAALIFSGYRALTGGMNWAGNWPLWGVLRWSDMGFYETDRLAIVLNRVMILGLTVFFTAVAVRLFRRRAVDGVRLMHRLAPRQLFRTGVSLSPYAVVPAVCCVALMFQVSQGLEGGAMKKAKKDYWAKNLKTWLNAPLPDIARVDVALRIDPAKHWLSSQGTLTLVNREATELAAIPLSGGWHWDSLTWTMDAKPYTPDDSKRLYLFRPDRPLAPGDSVTIGWKWDGVFPKGITKNGGNTDEFILPSGVVLTGFSPSFMPVVGFMEDVGETKDNRTEPKQYPRDYWKGVTKGGYGATAWFPARVTVTGPAEYTLNSVGVCTKNEVKDGWRTQVWETDHPVKIMNVVCGRWKEKRGESTTIYYHPAHTYNLQEMSATLDAARKWYSEWFLPYPWRELKLSEFPALAGYAQGFGTNITFSENIGFLTKNDEKTNATFLVTAHEAAHQWWGNILTPANGPGADFLSEGMSHFSTLLLFEQVKGPKARMEFAKGIESRYGDRRRPDEERPMYEIDGKRPSDETVMYDRGGWVFWMLYDFMGHERALEGYQHFIRTWSQSRDHAALPDFVLAMRPFAADTASYDAFTKQWFEGRVVPEYRLVGTSKKTPDGRYEVTVKVTNRGTGRMPVEVAVTRGERWEKTASDSAAYREARALVKPGKDETETVVVRCDFEPDQVVVDPDVRVLQLNRKLAVAKL